MKIFAIILLLLVSSFDLKVGKIGSVRSPLQLTTAAKYYWLTWLHLARVDLSLHCSKEVCLIWNVVCGLRSKGRLQDVGLSSSRRTGGWPCHKSICINLALVCLHREISVDATGSRSPVMYLWVRALSRKPMITRPRQDKWSVIRKVIVAWFRELLLHRANCIEFIIRTDNVESCRVAATARGWLLDLHSFTNRQHFVI